MKAPDQKKWRQLWQAAGCQGDSQSWFERLACAYSQPHRHYHNFRHIAECLDLFQAEARFDEFEVQIRQEYSWVATQEFATQRAAVLMQFLGRKAIYATEFFRERFECQARSNLKRSVQRLHLMMT